MSSQSSVFKEASRLLGVSRADPSFVNELQNAYGLLLSVANPKSVYKIIPIIQTENGIKLEDIEIISFDTKKLFSSSERAIILAATLGADVDALIRRKMACDMHTAMLLDACASAEIERVCDDLEQKIFGKLNSNEFLTRRFSPGYGDLDIKYSSALVNALHTQKHVGLSVTNSDMLVPTKSVTAIIGISNTKQNRYRRCDECAVNNECIYKKRGERCGI